MGQSPSSPARGPEGPIAIGLHGQRLLVWTLGAVAVGAVVVGAALAFTHAKADAEQEQRLAALEAFVRPANAAALEPIRVSLTSTRAGPGGCVPAGEIDVREQPRGARLTFEACRGTSAGCAGSGGNWLMVRTCRVEAPEDCVDAPAFISYGVTSSSPALDVSAVVDRPGRYAVAVCDAGCAQSPSETAGPCCGERCGTCQASSVRSRCTTPLRGSDYVYGHFSAIDYTFTAR